MHLLNPTAESINLYSGCSLAKLSEVKMVIDMSKESDVAEDIVQWVVMMVVFHWRKCWQTW